MQDQVFISVIVVCYNYENLLPRALNAIAQQSFRDFELVFVNNGCTDHSLDVFNRFHKDHPDIPVKLVMIEKNIGLPYGDNKGVEAASGKYLMFCDADDWMDKDTLKILAEAAKTNDADRVIAAFRDVNDNGKIKQIQSLGDEPVGWLYGMQQANLFRTSIYRDNHIKTGSLWVDAEKTFKFSSACRKCAFVKEVCYNYLVHLDSTSRNKEIYKRISEPQYSFENFLQSCLPYLPHKDEQAYIFAEYQLARYYYSYLFQFTRDAPLKEKMKIYDRLKGYMQVNVPDYLDSVHAALKYKKATRPYARKIAIIASILEYTRMMKLGLVAYHFASKVFFFQV